MVLFGSYRLSESKSQCLPIQTTFSLNRKTHLDVEDNVKGPMDETAEGVDEDATPSDEEAGTSSVEASDELKVAPDDDDLKASDEVVT